MAQYELEGLFSASLDGLKGMVDSNTVIGKPIETVDGTTIIPITRLSVGYGVGGWNYGGEKTTEDLKKDGITAGSGGGVTVLPQSGYLWSKHPAFAGNAHGKILQKLRKFSSLLLP